MLERKKGNKIVPVKGGFKNIKDGDIFRVADPCEGEGSGPGPWFLAASDGKQKPHPTEEGQTVWSCDFYYLD